jgi:6-phosphofructokinase
VPFSEERFLRKAEETLSALGEAVIVVQEDITDAETGRSLAEVKAENVELDPHGNIQHGRAGSFQPAVYIAQLVQEKLRVPAIPGKVKEAALVPQHIQRSCMMSNVDAAEAYKVGSRCVDALDAGFTRKSVIITRDKGKTYTDLTELENIARKERNVPLEYINGLDGPTQEFIDDFLYLIGGPMGIPRYSAMKFRPVAVPDAIASEPYISK